MRMKLSNSTRNAMRELDRVVAKALKTVEFAQTADKKTLERLLDSIIFRLQRIAA